MFAAIFTITAVIAKIVGCGAPAFLLGFNVRGSLRIGAGMVPRGEMTLVAAGIGLVSGVFDSSVFAGLLLSVVLTTALTAPLLNAVLQFRGNGTARPVKGDDSVSALWEFSSRNITGLVTGNFLGALRSSGFYVQMMDIDSGLYQARKNDISLSITEYEKSLGVATAGVDMPFVRNVVYGVISGIYDAVEKLKDSSDPRAHSDTPEKTWTNQELLALIRPECVSVALKGNTKNEVITELVDILATSGRLFNRNLVLNDVFEREKIMSTGMQHGIAMPHAKSGGANGFAVAVGIKKDGVDFESADGEKSRVFVMMVSPRKSGGPHIQFLSAASAVLREKAAREAILNAASPAEVVGVFKQGI
jgi:mannitol/fructose-specific phosphotransferase system IIA component (Ntr-type)